MKIQSEQSKNGTLRAASWIPSLYFAEALPYMVVTALSVMIYTKMGLTDAELAFYTSWLYLPWVIKPIWSPIVDVLRTKRWWILAMQLLMGAGLGGVALTLNTDWWLQGSICFFWLLAFSSATHDIAADGIYIIGLTKQQQAFYVGIRNTFYRLGMIFCQGLIVMLAGYLAHKYGIAMGWSIAVLICAAVMVCLGVWHFFALPRVENQNTERKGMHDLHILSSFVDTVRVFSRKPYIWASLLFMLLFRFPEAQLGIIAKPFMMREVAEGGMAMTTESVGFVYGTIGVIALLLGGVLGGLAVARYQLHRCWWPMILAISVPDLVYVYFALVQPTDLWIINTGVALEQLGYGFGFTAYSLFLVYFARGEKSTSVFSLCTGIQSLGMMLPGLIAGELADSWGYANFFLWVCGCTVVTFLVSAFVKIPKDA